MKEWMLTKEEANIAYHSAWSNPERQLAVAKAQACKIERWLFGQCTELHRDDFKVLWGNYNRLRKDCSSCMAKFRTD